MRRGAIGSFPARGYRMQKRFGAIGLAAAFLAATSPIGYAQTNTDPGMAGSTVPRPAGPGSATPAEGGTTVFRGAAGTAGNAVEISGAGSRPDGSTSAYPAGPGGTTVFHGAPGGTSSRLGLPGAAPPSAPPGPEVGASR
jgi:hypothetical protein